MGLLDKMFGGVPAQETKQTTQLSVPAGLPMQANTQWSISVSFGHSASKNMGRALHLAREAQQFEEYEFEGQMVYQAWYNATPSSFLSFIRLYEIVESWKSTACMIYGQLVDRKIIGGIKYCYGDKCRNGRDDFCFGASQFTANPFGCHRLQISTYNNPWWTFGVWQGDTFLVDKNALRSRIDQYSTAYRVCPDFMYDDVIRRLDALPNRLTKREYDTIQAQAFGGYLMR